jgi:hypothetical protein
VLGFPVGCKYLPFFFSILNPETDGKCNRTTIQSAIGTHRGSLTQRPRTSNAGYRFSTLMSRGVLRMAILYIGLAVVGLALGRRRILERGRALMERVTKLEYDEDISFFI